MTTFTIGQEVIYKVRGGWGGGETVRLVAVVERLHAKSAIVSLWNTQHNRKDLKRVRLSSLEARTANICSGYEDWYTRTKSEDDHFIIPDGVTVQIDSVIGDEAYITYHPIKQMTIKHHIPLHFLRRIN